MEAENTCTSRVGPEQADTISETKRLNWFDCRLLLDAFSKHHTRLPLIVLAYFIAGILGQATANIRSSNLGPVWPAYGVALAAILLCGYRAWIGVAVGAFLVAFLSPVPHLAAAGQAAGATVAALVGAFLLRRISSFDPSLSRLRDALGLIVFGAFGSALLSATIGLSALYVTGVQAYSGLGSAWLIYWLGDSTGVLLVTPLVFTLPSLLRNRSWANKVELAALVTLLTATCLIVFGDLPALSVKLHVLAFAVLPFVMWAAIDLGVGGAALSVFVIATIATVETALGSGPFAANTSFINGVLLDVFFTVLAVSGLTLAAVTTERGHAEKERETLVREQAGRAARLRLAAIVESSDDAIFSTSVDGIILSWNAGAERIFGFAAAEAVGRPTTIFIPAARWNEENGILKRLRAGERIERYRTIRVTKAGTEIDVLLTVSPVKNSIGMIIGAAIIARDISEAKRAEEALASMSRRLIEAQEQERTRIARELHDDIGQRLSLMACRLDQMPRDFPRLLELHPHLRRLQEELSNTAEAVHYLSHELHSPKLDYLGIVATMNGFCREFGDQNRMDVKFNTYELPGSVSREVSLCLFRVLQEALRNAAKYSGVEHVEVRLWGTLGLIHLMIKDEGLGFDVIAAKQSQGLGLLSMEERLKLLNGDISIESQPKGGTTIHARIPFSVEKSVSQTSGR